MDAWKSHLHKAWHSINDRGLKFRAIVVAVVVIIVVICFHFIAANNKKIKTPTIPVVASQVQSKDVPVYIPGLGAVTPVYTVTVRTQINGQLFQVFYKEGQMVKAGELLAQIDPRPYEAQLMQDEGQMQRDQALLANARIDLNRYQTLWRQDSVSQQTLATQQALVKQYEGAVKLDQGLIAAVKVNLIYCRITAPVDGRIGLRIVDPGNFVQTTDTGGIAVITTLNPITVIFTIPEDNVPQVMQQINAGKTLSAFAYDRSQTQLLAKGKLLTIDNEIDPATGTVKLRAEFDNSKNMLFPNQFVNVNLLVKTLHNALVVPTAAIQHDPNGTFVFLINNKNKVYSQRVVVGPVSGEYTVVTTGLSLGQSVVIEGIDRLADGSKVSVARTSMMLAQAGDIGFHGAHS